MASPLVLSYNLRGFEAAALAHLCKEQDIRLREVSPQEYGLPVGALAGIPVASSALSPSAEPFEEPMLVICHMLSDQLDAFLKGIRAPGMPRIALKAVLTPNNVAWDSRKLHDELAREHAAMRRPQANQ